MDTLQNTPAPLPQKGLKGRRRLPVADRLEGKKQRYGGTCTLTPAVHDAIIEHVRAGAHGSVAAAACGVPQTTFSDWVTKGLDPECTSPNRDAYRALVVAIAEAEASVESRTVRRVLDASEQTWQAAAWYLERKHKERWARADQLDVTSRGQGLFDVLLRVDADRRGEMIEGEVIGELPDAVSSQDAQEGV